ncbi:MAG: hypothetical protein IPP62_14360 [bacterium]|jgi:hypothetical protein|nr:hypothetical protein [bacterium]
MAERLDQVLDRLDSLVAHLGDMADELTLVGGCLTPLLITDPAAPAPRATLDIDMIVEVATHSAYHRLNQRMMAQGFHLGSDPDDPICRFRKADLVVDLMPTDARVLGFGSIWYAQAAATAATITLPSGRQLRHATAPLFLATKIEAFRSRGKGDYLESRDFEDIVALVDGRSELAGELAAAPGELRDWVRAEVGAMMGDRGFTDSLYGMFPGPGDVAGRVVLVRARFDALASG